MYPVKRSIGASVIRRKLYMSVLKTCIPELLLPVINKYPEIRSAVEAKIRK
jgi:hypothetical protein